MRTAQSWLARVPSTDQPMLAVLRLLAGVECCIADGWTWVRGPGAVPDTVQQVPGLVPMEAMDGAPLLARLPGRHLPTAVVPDGPWQPIRSTFPITMPPSAMAAGVSTGQLPVLVPGGFEQPTVGLCCPWARFQAWAETAPEHRLLALCFAASAEGTGPQALVLGTPLPPLVGTTCWRSGPLLLPAGWMLDPSVSDQWVESWLGLAAGELVLVQGAGAATTWARIPAASRVAARRSAVRATGSSLTAAPA